VIAYLRRSKDDETGLSFAAQLAAITKAYGSPDAVYRDEGISGARADRPGLLAALEALGKGDTLAVAKRDRLARDAMLGAWLDLEAAKRGASIVSAAGEGNGDDPADKLMRRMIDAFAEYERAIIAARTRAALAQKRARGEKTGGQVPYGYRLGSNGRTLVEESAEQEVITKCARWRSRRRTWRWIARRLDQLGIPAREGGWHHTKVARIVTRAASAA